MHPSSRLKWKIFKLLGYIPRAGQLALHKRADYHRFLGYFAYPRAGKSYGAAIEVAATYALPDWRCWIVAPTYPLGAKEFGYIWNAHDRLGWLKDAKRKVFNEAGGDMEITYPHGWFVKVMSAENPDSILAEELNEVILAEGARLPRTIWTRHLLARIEKRRGRVFLPTTPKGFNWCYEVFYRKGRKHITPYLESGAVGDLNPDYDPEYWAAVISHLPGEGDIFQDGVFSPEAIERGRREMDPATFREQFGGAFVSYSGLVYSVLPRTKCLAFPIPLEWTVVLGYDHGANDPTAIVFGAWDNRSPRHLWLYDLVYDTGHSARWYAKEIHRRIQPGQSVTAISCDPSAKQVRIELAHLGLPTVIPPFKAFEARYTKLTALIEQGRLHIFDTSAMQKLFWEFGRYEWKEDNRGERKGDKVRGPDHAINALEYLTLYPIQDVLEPTEEEKYPGLDPASSRMWRSLDRRYRQMKEEEEREEWLDALVTDPMEELERLYVE